MRKTNLRKYQRVLESARKRDVNESDTSVIVKDMLSDLLGYDKYEEVTTELAIRSTRSRKSRPNTKGNEAKTSCHGIYGAAL